MRRAFTLGRIDCRVSNNAVAQNSSRVVVLLLLIPIVFNAITLLPELSLPVPSLNDDAFHYLFIQRASDALAQGENPFDHWAPELELGFPQFSFYQHLPHLTVVILHRILLKSVELLTLFNLIRYLLLVGFPLTVWWSMRRLGFSAIAAAVAASSATLLSSNHRYGFEYDSYVWRGLGMYTQLWAMHLSFITLACLHRLLGRGTGYAAAVIASAALVMSHLVYAYMMAVTAIALLLLGLNRATARPRAIRFAVTAALTAIVTSYFWLPFLLYKAYLSASPYLQRWKYDSFGAPDILTVLINGDLLDYGRLPVLTVLLALGLVSALLSRTSPARLSLVLLLLWLALYFGRPTWGRLLDLLPMHEGLLLHRFIGGVHLAAILLIGLGGEWIWQRLGALSERWRALTAGVLLAAMLVPAFRERWNYYAANTQWLERTKSALDADPDARAILSTLKDLPPGRTYAGLRDNWGKGLTFGDLHFWDLLTFHRIPAVSPPYQSLSLNADLIWHFDFQNSAHYTLFNVKYVVAPSKLAMPQFLRPIKETPGYTLYQAETGGYAGFASITGTRRIDSQSSLFVKNRDWLLGNESAAGRFVRYDYPAGSGQTGTREEVAEPSGPQSCRSDSGDGTIREEEVRPGRLDLRVECPMASTLVLRVTYHPSWQVTIDGRSEQPFMISPSFIGIYVPPGSHQIRAEYRSPTYKTALLLLGLAALLATIRFRRSLAQLDSAVASRP